MIFGFGDFCLYLTKQFYGENMKPEIINLRSIIYSDDALLTKKVNQNAIFKNTVGKLTGIISQYQVKDLLANHIKCSPKNFSNLYNFTKQFSKKLGIVPPQLFVSESNAINAYTYGSKDKSFIVIHSKLLDTFSDEEIKFVIGHELGHIAAGHSHIMTITNLFFNVSTISLGYFPSKVFYTALNSLKFVMMTLKQWEKAAEITADRFGFLAVSNQKIAYNALINLKLGMINRKEIDVDEYLKQFDEISENWIYKVNEIADQISSTHPNVFRRIMVLKLFADNISTMDLTNKELDSKIHSLLLGTNRGLLSSDEKFEELVLKSIIYIAQADRTIDNKEKKMFSSMLKKLTLSDKLLTRIDKKINSSIKLNEIKLTFDLNDYQLEFLSNTVADVAIADGVYSFEEDLKLNKLFDHLKLSKNYLDEKRAIFIKKYGDIDFIKNILKK